LEGIKVIERAEVGDSVDVGLLVAVGVGVACSRFMILVGALEGSTVGSSITNVGDAVDGAVVEFDRLDGKGDGRFVDPSMNPLNGEADGSG
jgi:hypothetical protein